jgi:hypothetical protein
MEGACNTVPIGVPTDEGARFLCYVGQAAQAAPSTRRSRSSASNKTGVGCKSEKRR